ncbi:MAG: hypothetical protein FWH03_00720 [Firmicutes bacterium]|nr:hypothetical protein [Bacillota bacterium]
MDRMVVYNIIAGLVKAQLKCPECTASRSSDGSSVVFTITGYPTFPSGQNGTVIATYPFTWLSLSNANGKVAVAPGRMNSTSARFWQNSVGTPFLHAHIFNDGHPCWGHNNQGLSTVKEVVEHLILTLRCANIGEYSIRVGVPATRNFGNTVAEIMKNARNQAARVDKKYGLSPVKGIELPQWIDAQFRLRVGMLRWQ